MTRRTGTQLVPWGPRRSRNRQPPPTHGSKARPVVCPCEPGTDHRRNREFGRPSPERMGCEEEARGCGENPAQRRRYPEGMGTRAKRMAREPGGRQKNPGEDRPSRAAWPVEAKGHPNPPAIDARPRRFQLFETATWTDTEGRQVQAAQRDRSGRSNEKRTARWRVPGRRGSLCSVAGQLGGQPAALARTAGRAGRSHLSSRRVRTMSANSSSGKSALTA